MRAELIGLRINGPEPVKFAVVPVRTGGVTALYGLNGAGKSRVLSGLDATVRGLRPPRRENSDGSLILHLVAVGDEKADTTYAGPLATRAADELRKLRKLLAEHRGGGRASGTPALKGLLGDITRLSLLTQPDDDDLPNEIDEIVRATAETRMVAVRVIDLPDDRVDAGDPRPVRFVPAVPDTVRQAVDALDLDHPAVDAEAVTRLRYRFAKSASDVPVPLYVPKRPDPVTLTASDLSLLPPVVRLEDDDFTTPTLAVLYGVPTLREELDVAHRPLIDVADKHDFELETDVAESARQLQDQANRIYRRVLEDAPPLRLRIRHPNDWARRSAVRWEAEVSADPPTTLPAPKDEELSGRWLAIPDLSTGQRRWASFAIRVACLIADPADGPYGAVVILDEPEQALHRQAERYCADGLRRLAAELGLVVIAATHSPEVLDAADVMPLHVTRDAEATTQVAAFAGWLSAEEDTLGLARSDLVLRYRTFLLVEGVHDEAMLEAWAGEDLERARTRILRLGGSHQLTPVLTSQLLFEMTDARVVVLLDAIDHERFDGAWGQAVEAWRGDDKPRARSLLAELEREGGEMGILAEFCLEALGRGHDGRIHPFGLGRADIIEYVPVQALAADRPETWAQLRREAERQHGRGMSGRRYKDWLKGRGVKISEGSLREAAEQTERPPEVDALVALCRSTSQMRTAARDEPAVAAVAAGDGDVAAGAT